ncbi:MAG: MarR family transcriptional regulator [Chloroflexi bacterium]|nr:MarR family transcriptional regulator [Chloroflexota bacterium]
MKTKAPSHILLAQVEQLKHIWQDLLGLQGQLQSALPAALVRAKARLGAAESETLRGPGYHLPFLRLANVFAQQVRPLTMGEISEALHVPLSTATRMVDSLVEHGYAERLPDPQDRRIVRVTLSPSGKELYAMVNHFFSERMYEFLSHFSPAERKQLLALFEKTVTVLRQMNS